MKTAFNIKPILVLVLILWFANSAIAATFTVNNNTLDAPDAAAGNGVCADLFGNCTLRAAINEANASAGADTIAFNLPAASTITLTLGEAVISSPLTIDGSGASNLTVAGTVNSRVFSVPDQPGTELLPVTMRGFTISGGNATEINNGTGSGGGISVISAMLTFENMVVTGNTAANRGGGLFLADGVINLIDSSISGNTAMDIGGGAQLQNSSATFERLDLSNNRAETNMIGTTAGGMVIFGNDQNTITFNDSIIADNFSTSGGGGLDLVGGVYSISNSIFSGNESSAGGGMRISVSTVAIVNTTFSGNTAQVGGGMFNSFNGFTSLRNVTFSRNVTTRNIGGAITCSFNSALDFANTIFADSVNSTGATAPDTNGPTTSFGFNLIETPGNTRDAPIMGDITGNILGVDPQLQPLADNGGRTRTHALAATSPAFNRGGNQFAVNTFSNSALTTDQRGASFERVANSRIDIGAFEFQGVTAAQVELGGTVFTSANRPASRARVTLISSDGETQTIQTDHRGRFRFINATAGGVYLLTIRHKRFGTATESISVNEAVTDLTFTLSSN